MLFKATCTSRLPLLTCNFLTNEVANYLRSEERAKQLSQRLPKKSVLADWLINLVLVVGGECTPKELRIT